MAKPKDMSKEQMVAEIDRLKASGMSVKAAAKQLGTHFTTYYAAKREAGTSRNAVMKSHASEIHILRRENELLRQLADLRK